MNRGFPGLFRRERQRFWPTPRFTKTASAGYPELGADGICSGYREQAASLRRFQVTIEDRLNRKPTPPPVILRAGGR